jgi:hypothetical protein
MKTIKIESAIWNFFIGKRTYIVGALALSYGWYFKDPQAIFVGLGLFGLRAAISHDIAKLLDQPIITKTDIEKTAGEVVIDATQVTEGTASTGTQPIGEVIQ